MSRGNTDAYGHEESSEFDRRAAEWDRFKEKGVGRTVVSQWYDDSRNIAELIRWLHERGELAMEVNEVCYLVSKPWKWSSEYSRMQLEKKP